MRWETQDPIPQQIVSDGESLWIYDLDLEQVTREPAETLENTPAGLLLSLAPDELGVRFAVSKTVGTQGRVTYQLTPRDDQLYQLIIIEFLGDQPISLGVVDSTNQQTRIQLRDVTINVPIPADRFTFEVPDGVDLIDGR